MFNKMIDHTLLKADATRTEIETLCQEAIANDFASVCVNPYYVSACEELLSDSDVLVCTVVGFPLGQSTSDIKGYETANAIANGAQEIDMVINVAALKQGLHEYVLQDIKSVVNNANGKCVKVILETCLLSDDEIVLGCKLAMEAKANFVKTSTGFSTGGATVEAVALMKSIVGDELEVKASGGIKTLEQMTLFIDAGATRIGTSSGVALVLGQEGTSSY